MKLAVFDLDRTLVPIDTGALWTRWIAGRTGRCAEALEREAEEWGRRRPADGFVLFQFSLLVAEPRERLEAWRDAFIERVVRPSVPDASRRLLASRRQAGFELLLATGTHRFIAEPVASLLGIDHVVAATPEEAPDGSFTGGLVGWDSFGTGKARLVREWIIRHGGLEEIEAWSDAIDDLPLLECAADFRPSGKGRAVATNPDRRLAQVALERGWEVVRLF